MDRSSQKGVGTRGLWRVAKESEEQAAGAKDKALGGDRGSSGGPWELSVKIWPWHGKRRVGIVGVEDSAAWPKCWAAERLGRRTPGQGN